MVTRLLLFIAGGLLLLIAVGPVPLAFAGAALCVLAVALPGARRVWWAFRYHGARYGLSMLVPVPMASTYGVLAEPWRLTDYDDARTLITPDEAREVDEAALPPCQWVRERWWQWRDRAFLSRTSPVAV